jgi:hypothetical protein
MADQDSASRIAADVGSWPRRRRPPQTAREIHPQAEMHGAPLRSMVGLIMHVRPVLTVLLVALTSCSKYMDGYSCFNPDRGHKDALNNPDPCHKHDPDAGTPSADAGQACAEICLPPPSALWDGPYLLWTGDEADAPRCSDFPGDLREIYTGHGDLDAPTHCDACACAPPTGSCALPATLTASAASCTDDGPGVAHTPFDPPPKWEDTCTSANAIPPGKLCGGVPCVQSVTIAPLTLKESECLPIQPPDVQPPATWKKFARACTNGLAPSCGWGRLCVPPVPEPQFKQCISIDGNAAHSACPPEYPNRNVFYDFFTDSRSCPACACEAPVGSTCTGSITMFSDSACGVPVNSTVPLDATGTSCTDIKPAGSALGSKSASTPIFTPGQCAPKLDSTEAQLATPGGAVIWCCQDTP